MSLHRLIHKGTSLNYHGNSIQFSLSMGLFSSNDIDAGSRYLLKSLAQELKDIHPETLLDIGCGVGTLGLAFQKWQSQCDITLRDRDALACAFSRHNAQINKIGKIQIESALFLENLGERRFDLILSNIPAKAGETVIAHFIRESVHYCTARGRVAVVVVSPLREQVEQLLQEESMEILYTEHSKMYSLFHFRSSQQREPKDPGLELYFRHSGEFQLEDLIYPLTTVYNIPDFDQVSWKDELAASSMKGINRGGTWFFHNPGQGHQLIYLMHRQKAKPERIILSSRDTLQLRIAAYNAKKTGFKGEIIELPLAQYENWKEFIEKGSVDFAMIHLEPVPRSRWEEPLKDATQWIMKDGGIYHWLGRSKDIQPLLKNQKASSIMQDKRNKGWRSVILKKNPSTS